MHNPMTDEDRALDALWRERFGEPLPILGAGDIVRAVLGLPTAAPPPAEAA
jgi:hypothetical protein